MDTPFDIAHTEAPTVAEERLVMARVRTGKAIPAGFTFDGKEVRRIKKDDLARINKAANDQLAAAEKQADDDAKILAKADTGDA